MFLCITSNLYYQSQVIVVAFSVFVYHLYLKLKFNCIGVKAITFCFLESFLAYVIELSKLYVP